MADLPVFDLPVFDLPVFDLPSVRLAPMVAAEIRGSERYALAQVQTGAEQDAWRVTATIS
jgi:hypothetical protein